VGGGARRDERRGRAATAAALHNACLPARSFFEARFTPVIDDIVIGDRWEHLKADLDGVRFTRVVLAPSPDLVATERDVGRGKRVLGEKWARYLDGALRGTMASAGIWIDNSGQTPGETVDEVIRGLDAGFTA